MSETEAQHAALEALGTVDQIVRVVIDSNKGLRMLEISKDRLVLLSALLTLPGILLLGFSFLTFNFPCASVPVEQGTTSYVFERCGVSFLQPLRPWLSDFGVYGMAPWYQVTQFIVTTVGPLIAAIVLIAGQTHVRFDRQNGASVAIVLVKPAIHRMVVLAVAAVVFASVAAYKLAG